MKNLTLKITFITIISMGILVTSCNKKNEASPVDDTTISQDDALAENLFDEATGIADEAYGLKSLGLKSTDESIYLGPCAEITLDTTANPHELIIDFGEENCLCNDGKYRRGKIIVSFTGRYWWPGTVITTGFDEFYVNDNQLDGTKVLTNMGKNDDDHPYFLISVTGVVHKALDGGTFSWNAEMEREWVEGFTTKKIRDDVYHITGEASGIRPNGKTWDREIINELRKEMNCRFIVSGTVEIRPEDLSTRLLDFGDGECDNIATVLIDGVTYTIFLN
jgi:hypothetical protein